MSDSTISIKDMMKMIMRTAEKTMKITTLHRYPDEDVRQIIFTNILELLRWMCMSVNIFSVVKRNIIPKNDFALLFGMDPIEKRSFDGFDKVNRMSYATILNFQVENCLKNILRKIEGKEPPPTYGLILKNFFKNIHSIQNTKESEKIFRTLATLRNTLHSNGIHTKKNTSVVIGKFTYKFTKGDKIICGGWPYLCNMTYFVVDVLDKLIQTSEVQGINETISTVFIPIE